MDDAGWILGKNPGSKFEKEIKKGRFATGEFVEKEDESKATYIVKVHNDPLIFLEKHREKNSSHYVDIALSSCVPYNLNIFGTVLKSLLQSKYSPEAKRSADLFDQKITIGVT